ncbi:MAG: hypothetical protein JNL83_27835, partial [Myxococcales bacterium]|nr:hypothetical protein [Myxococcales bacterium]
MRRLAVLVVALCGCGRLGFEDRAIATEDCALAIEPAQWRMNFNSTRAFAGTGGQAPYQYRFTGTGATLDAGSDTLRARDQPGTGTVTVTDGAGCTAEASVEIGGDTLWYVGGSSMGVPSAQVYKSTDG